MADQVFKKTITNNGLMTLAWVVGLLSIALTAGILLPYQPSFPYYDSILPGTGLPKWLYSWANFDGVHYITIVQKGYLGTGLIQAFFPLFPLMGKALALLVKNAFLGLWIGNITALIGLWYVWPKLSKASAYNHHETQWSWLSLLLFPTAFFLFGAYSESLFLLLVVTSFFAARTKNWRLAVVAASLASATRIVGVFLAPALIIEAFIQFLETSKYKKDLEKIEKQIKKADFKKIPAASRFLAPAVKDFVVSKASLISLLFLSISGLVIYMLYLWKTFGDPLYFYHVQSEFGAGREESLVLVPQVIWRYLKILATYRPFDLKYYAFTQELILSLGSLAALLYSFFKVRTSYVVFSLLAWLLPTLTGTFSSMPRYILVCFPLFLLAGQLLHNNKKLRFLYILVSILWLWFNTALFIQGYWVA